MKQKNIIITLSVLIMFVGIAITASAKQQVGQWEKLGENKVNFTTERDVIHCSSRQTYSKLKFIVKEAPVEFLKVVVKFESGASQEIALKKVIRAGGETRVIDLVGNKRIIKEIVFYYKVAQGHKYKRAIVVVWGKR